MTLGVAANRKAAKRVGAGLVAAGLLLGGLAACGGDGSSDAAPPVVVHTTESHSPYQGTELPQPLKKPDLVLTDQDGKRYDLRRQTRDKLTLFYVGYTHCPDVCPTTMADLAQVRAKLSRQERAKLRIVFVSSDPKRDTPKRLTKWLGSFDPSIVGLTGDFRTIQKAVKPLGIGISPPKKEHGQIIVQHSAQVLLFGQDDRARVTYTVGFHASAVVHDLRYLLRKEPS